MFDKIFNLIIKENMILLYVNNNNQSPNITDEQQKEYLYFINQINYVKSSQDNKYKMQQLLITILTSAIFYSHSTLISFLITNEFIDNIDKVKFDTDSIDDGHNNNNHDNNNNNSSNSNSNIKKEKKNLLSFILENCNHRIDIIESIVTKNSNCISNFESLLTEKTGDKTQARLINGKLIEHCVIHEFMANDARFGPVVKYLSKNHFHLFIKCHVIGYVFHYRLLSLAKFIIVPDILDGRKKHEMIRFDVPRSFSLQWPNEDHIAMFIDLLETNNMKIDEFFKQVHCPPPDDFDPELKLKSMSCKNAMYGMSQQILQMNNFGLFKKYTQFIGNDHINDLIGDLSHSFFLIGNFCCIFRLSAVW